MPGPMSDSYDPEFGTSSNCNDIKEAIDGVYEEVSEVLGKKKPMYVLDLVHSDLPNLIQAKLSERTWRIIRFSLERAKESI